MWNKFVGWLESFFLYGNKTFPHDDPCWGCNRGSCTDEKGKCEVLTGKWTMAGDEVRNEETF